MSYKKTPDRYQEEAQNTDFNHRFPIVIVVDTTISMTWKQPGDNQSLLEHLNENIREFLLEIVQDPDIRPHAYVSYVAFADDVTMETDFKKPGKLSRQDFREINGSGQQVSMVNESYMRFSAPESVNIPVFHDIGRPTYSHIARGVKRAIEKLEAYKDSLKQQNIRYYVPMMVLITDGAPEDTSDPMEEEKAINEVNYHCVSYGGTENLIIPLICGIGTNAGNTDLVRYADGCKKGLRIVDPSKAREGFRGFFDLIRGSITQTIDLNSYQNMSPKPEQYRKRRTAEEYVYDTAGYGE